MAWIEHDYPDTDALHAAVAQCLHAACADAIDARGSALLALAGGRTPLPLYGVFVAMSLPWDRVVAMPTDERCVPHDHPACNLARLVDAFSIAPHMTLRSLTVADGDPQRSLVLARTMLAEYAQPFDAVVLGMGADAHTASLFPNAPGLAAALDPDNADDACRIDPEPLPAEAPFPRITLTAARLLRARTLHVVVTGADKRAVLRAAQASADPLRQPIAAFLHAPQARMHLHWAP